MGFCLKHIVSPNPSWVYHHVSIFCCWIGVAMLEPFSDTPILREDWAFAGGVLIV